MYMCVSLLCVPSLDLNLLNPTPAPSLQEYMPLPPSGEGEQPKLEFSIVECLLFAFHQLVKGRQIEFLTAEEHADRLKDFRQRSVRFKVQCHIPDGFYHVRYTSEFCIC